MTDTVESPEATFTSAPTEPTTDDASTATGAPAQRSGRRGRPRPSATIERDGVVLRMVDPVNGTTREALATALGVTPGQAYLSLHRLRATGLVRRERQGPNHSWFLTDAGVVAASAAQPGESPTDAQTSDAPTE